MKIINKVFLILFLSQVLSDAHLGASEGQRVINVSTVEQLYAAVNNANNVDATIQLAPGTYVLSATNSQGKPRAHDGALRLRPGMSLVGSEQRVDSNFDGIPDPVSPSTPDDFAMPGTETKIDGSELALQNKVRRSCGSTSTEFLEPMIAINRSNTISSLNLFGGDNIAIGEPANPVDSAKSLSITIVNTVIDSFFIPMSFSNSGCDRSHANSVLILSNNVVRNGNFFGLAMFNFITGNDANDRSNGPEIKATVSNNLFYNNGGTALSVRGGAVGTDGGLLTIEMTGNIFRNNGSNFLGVGGGGGRLATTPAIGNRLQITSRADTFGEAIGQSPSIILVAGVSPGPPEEPIHCTLDANFFDTRFVRDTPVNPDFPEMLILGGENGGTGNHAWVLIRQATVKTSLGAPTSGALSIQDETTVGPVPNTARLKGSREDFLKLNQGFHAPPNRFFIKK